MDLNGRRLIRAARAGSLGEVGRLLRLEASLVAAEDEDGMTALLWAAREGHMSVARLLLQYGAKVNHMDCDGHSALFEACAHGREALAVMLIRDFQADVSFKDWQTGISPLMAACDEDGHPELVRCILRVRREEAWERDWGGRTALWWACFWGAPPQVLRLLLHEGRADYAMPDHHGRTPLDVAPQGDAQCHHLITEAAAEGVRAYVLYKARRLTDLHHCLAFQPSPAHTPTPRPLPTVLLRLDVSCCGCGCVSPRACGSAGGAVKGGGSPVPLGGGRGGQPRQAQGHDSPRAPAQAGGEQWRLSESPHKAEPGQQDRRPKPQEPKAKDTGHSCTARPDTPRQEVLRAVVGYVVTSMPADLFHDLFQHLWYPLGCPQGQGSSQDRGGWHEMMGHQPQQAPVTWQGDDWEEHEADTPITY